MKDFSQKTKTGRRFLQVLFWGILLISMAACSSKTPTIPEDAPVEKPTVPQEEPVVPPEIPALIRLSPEDYPLFSDDLEYKDLRNALYKSLEFYRRLPPERPVRFGEDSYPASHMMTTTLHLITLMDEKPDDATLNRKLKTDFLVYRAAGTPPPGSDLRPAGKVLFTGYYEPLLSGSLQKSARFSVPLHGVPKDLSEIDLSPFGKAYAGKRIRGRWTGKTFVPYPDGDAINYEGVLKGKAPVIAYIDSPIDKFFLQVQGSGIVYLEEGGTLRVSYHNQNGRAYHSIGAYLINTGKVPKEEMSMARIREYFKENPEEQREILAFNPSYVFFRTVAKGPIGALGFPLTTGRSLAVDRRVFPDGAPIFVQTVRPLLLADGAIASWQPFSRFMAAQDTGGAIRGSGRADIFWGNDAYAETSAGYLQHPGEMFFLVLKPEVKK